MSGHGKEQAADRKKDLLLLGADLAHVVDEAFSEVDVPASPVRPRDGVRRRAVVLDCRVFAVTSVDVADEFAMVFEGGEGSGCEEDGRKDGELHGG